MWTQPDAGSILEPSGKTRRIARSKARVKNYRAMLLRVPGRIAIPEPSEDIVQPRIILFPAAGRASCITTPRIFMMRTARNAVPILKRRADKKQNSSLDPLLDEDFLTPWVASANTIDRQTSSFIPVALPSTENRRVAARQFAASLKAHACKEPYPVSVPVSA